MSNRPACVVALMHLWVIALSFIVVALHPEWSLVSANQSDLSTGHGILLGWQVCKQNFDE